MAKPKIRHIAIFARNPDELAKFYQDIFEMEVVYTKGPGKSHYLSDGYLTLAILPHKLEGSAMTGLNHFGFAVTDVEKLRKRIAAKGLEEPKRRPPDRAFAEFRAVDPEGNWFDLSEGGYEEPKAEANAKKPEALV
ncbi:MAG TPA: VOC family protein [Candidatus Binatia bacterium]|nr:VOC family protein [Candidatus Binatia bacterium]